MPAAAIPCALLAGLGAACPGALVYNASTLQPPPVVREFRGAWVATVYNLDWPSKPGLSPATQRAEMVRILDKAAALGLNAILFQVRPACDAFYDSPREPWSFWLTGRMGRPPEPFYDPLAFTIDEAHKRGLELHAWFNPFRASPNAATIPASGGHVSKAQPALVKRYSAFLWLDPSHDGARQLAIDAILDVVRRYDIDGVHLDDYFYPYPDKNRTAFPDSAAYEKYKASGGALGRAAWRRSHTDRFVADLSRAVRGAKPAVRFGISPFGIWRPRVPEGTMAYIDACEDLAADSRKWLQSGWIDYLAPQLYWPTTSKQQPFGPLLKWWAAQNTKPVHLWPGLAGDRVGSDRNASEIVKQIKLIRSAGAGTGHILWNMKPLATDHRGLATLLKSSAYDGPALTPACPWLPAEKPAAPKLTVKETGGAVAASWTPAGGAPRRWVFQTRAAGKWRTRVLAGNAAAFTFEPGNVPDAVAVSGVDRAGNAGPASVAERAGLAAQ